MSKAFAYLRVSGKGQVDGDGFARQLKAIKAHAEANELEITRTFEEKGVSGSMELEHRPALANLMTALRADGVRTVIIEKLDRLARDQVVQELLLRDLASQGFTVISVMEPDYTKDDPNNPTKRLVRQILGAISEYEKSLIVLKLRGARLRKAAQEGRCEGQKPYGWHEREKAGLQRIQELRGQPLQIIAAVLELEGIQPRRGTRWHPYTVARILKANA